MTIGMTRSPETITNVCRFCFYAQNIAIIIVAYSSDITDDLILF